MGGVALLPLIGYTFWEDIKGSSPGKYLVGLKFEMSHSYKLLRHLLRNTLKFYSFIAGIIFIFLLIFDSIKGILNEILLFKQYSLFNVFVLSGTALLIYNIVQLSLKNSPLHDSLVGLKLKPAPKPPTAVKPIPRYLSRALG